MKRTLFDFFALIFTSLLAAVLFGKTNLNSHVEISEKILMLILSLAIIYFSIRIILLPYFIASSRNHRNKIPILLTTLFFGWSMGGWLIALIWSTTCNVEEKAENESKTSMNEHPIPSASNYKPAAYSYQKPAQNYYQPSPTYHRNIPID